MTSEAVAPAGSVGQHRRVPTAADVRDEVSSWLDSTWDSERPLAEWRALLADSGWGAPTWPTNFFGRGLEPTLAPVVAEEFSRHGAVGPAAGAGMTLAAPTILEHGSDELKHRLLRPILTGDHKWCQLFSEPGNGSDLAGLITRAELDGDEWVVSGQKVWTTGAGHAAYAMLLARTDWDVPKHRGITYFALPMGQPGIDVRPLRQMNNHSSFNEIFLTDVRVPADHVVGAPGEGWRAALTTLANERGLAPARHVAFPKGAGGRTVREATAEAAEYAKTYEWYPQRAGRADLVDEQVRGAGSDPLLRQRAAALHAVGRSAAWNVERGRVARTRGQAAGPEGSLGKLCASEIARRAASIHSSAAGAAAMLTGPDSPLDGIIAEVLVSVPAVSIAGGTDQIQRTIIGERVLGLPREPQPDKDAPFRSVRVNR
ncbi:MAG: acyl-CoA dehydrogenase family protein [Acidimicrobiales bacterium]